MLFGRTMLRFAALLLGLLPAWGCAPLRVPAFDPSGNRIFSGDSTSLSLPRCNEVLPTPAFAPAPRPPICPGACAAAPPCGNVPGSILPAAQLRNKSYVVVMPGRVVAPVGGEVIVVSGVCGDQGHYVMRQPLEWVLAPDSVGHIVQVGNNKWCFLTDWMSSGNAKKITPAFAKNKTHTHRQTVTRGTEKPIDDVVLGKGQSWVSLTSPTEGASHVTVLAPDEEDWERRRQTATIYWVDAQWVLPVPTAVRVGRGESAVLNTVLSRTGIAAPIEGWLVRYEAIDGPPALFENGQRSIEVPSDVNGQATARLTPQANEPGITQVAVQVIRPASRSGELPRMIVGQGLTSVAWSAPGLVVRAAGPAYADAEQPTTYRVEIANTGDVPAPDVVLNYQIPQGCTVISSNPPAQPFGDRLQWRLGDLPAKQGGRVVDLTVSMRLQARYEHRFRAVSIFNGQPSPDLQAEATANTIVNRSALMVRTNGPQTAPVGGEVKFLVEIENVSALPATNVTITDDFDPGLEHVSGRGSPLVTSLGTLAPGQKQGVQLTFVVRAPGRHCHRINVAADGGVKSTAQECVTATSEAPLPRMNVKMTGPESLRVGEEGMYVLEVRNTGAVPLTNVRISNRYSGSLRPTAATGKYELARNEISWMWPELAVGETVAFELKCVGQRADPGAICVGTAASDQGVSQTQQTTTNIVGRESPVEPSPSPPIGTTPTPPPQGPGGLSIDIVDTDDPVPVGKEFGYQIIVSNKLDTSDRQVAIAIDIPEGLKVVRVLGSPDPRFQGRTLVLQPIAEVRGREQLRPIELRVTADRPGTPQLRVEARSMRSPSGTTETEETRVVQE